MTGQFAAGEVMDFAWLPENQGVVLVNQNGAMTTEPDRFTPQAFLRTSSLTHFGIDPDGEHFAAVQENSRVLLGALSEGITQTLAALPGVVTSLAFSPDSTHLAVAASDANEVVVWDTRGGVIVGNFTLPYWLSDLAIAPDNRLLAGVDLTQFSLLFIDPTTGAIQNTLQWTESASPALYGALLSPDWRQIAWYARGTIQLMDAATGELGPALEHEDFIATIAWSPDSALLASAAAATIEGEFLPAVILWDVVTGEQLALLPMKSSISQLKFNPEGTLLGILTTDGEFQTWTIKP
jgi:WD40 repeat protein